MTKIAYLEKNFRTDSMATIARANQIIDAYQAEGYTLTLRQLYYQFVAGDLIPNTEKSYKNLGKLINNARLAGHIDWEAIEDRTRHLNSTPHWKEPSEMLDTCAKQFRLDKWSMGQEFYVEVWIEKEALLGVIERVCTELDVPYFACKGYNSQSEQWRAGQRLRDAECRCQLPVIIHLGDHDPSGIDMTRDNSDRLDLFSETEVEMRRIALNMHQIEEHSPPPNPTKLTDSRANGYIRKFGYDSWELDALEPRLIGDLIRETVLQYRDEDAWGKAVAEEKEHRDWLRELAEK